MNGGYKAGGGDIYRQSEQPIKKKRAGKEEDREGKRQMHFS